MTTPDLTPAMLAAIREATTRATAAELLLTTDALTTDALSNLVVGLRSAADSLTVEAMPDEAEWFARTADFLHALYDARRDAEPTTQGLN